MWCICYSSSLNCGLSISPTQKLAFDSYRETEQGRLTLKHVNVGFLWHEGTNVACTSGLKCLYSVVYSFDRNFMLISLSVLWTFFQKYIKIKGLSYYLWVKTMWILTLNYKEKIRRLDFYTLVFRRDVLWYGDVRPSILPSVSPSVRVSVRQSLFSALYSYMLWHIELKFCMSLSSYQQSIKLECRQFPSIFVGVMPLLELKILEIHSFPHLSPTCFDILC